MVLFICKEESSSGCEDELQAGKSRWYATVDMSEDGGDSGHNKKDRFQVCFDTIQKDLLMN